MKYILGFLLLTQVSYALVTDSVPVGCGYADFVFKSIPEWTQEKAQLNVPLTGQQGETGRRFLMYSDQSWILTFEFFSKEDPIYDVSCIVRTGPSEEAYDATFLHLERLPLQRLGSALRAEDEGRLKLLGTHNF